MKMLIQLRMVTLLWVNDSAVVGDNDGGKNRNCRQSRRMDFVIESGGIVNSGGKDELVYLENSEADVDVGDEVDEEFHGAVEDAIEGAVQGAFEGQYNEGDVDDGDDDGDYEDDGQDGYDGGKDDGKGDGSGEDNGEDDEDGHENCEDGGEGDENVVGDFIPEAPTVSH